MKIRLTLFLAAGILLPLFARFLSAQEWPQNMPIDGAVLLPALLSGSVLLAYTGLLDWLSWQRNASSLLRTQRGYALWLSIGGAICGALLAYLNTFSPLLLSSLSPGAAILLAALFGGIWLPGVLITRLWLAGSSTLLHRLTRIPPLPVLAPEHSASLLLLTALCGFLGGAVWPMQLTWLLYLSPLLLLTALQLLWHESTVFSGAGNGDWSRIVLGASSGILVGGGIFLVFTLAGGAFYLVVSPVLFTVLLGVSGLLCVQLGDVIAENWRGKKRIDISKRKPFPIPVVAKD